MTNDGWLTDDLVCLTPHNGKTQNSFPMFFFFRSWTLALGSSHRLFVRDCQILSYANCFDTMEMRAHNHNCK